MRKSSVVSVHEFLQIWLSMAKQKKLQRVLVACSGGVDSVVLLRMLASLQSSLSLQLVVGHVHHGLRETANRDARFVQELAEQLHLPAEIEYVHLQDISIQHRRGTEADARHLRYQALLRMAEKYQCDAIAVAHHADDQVETVLWRLLRGAYLSGLQGMQAESVVPQSHMRLLRPLLSFSKQAIEKTAQQNGWSWVEDESNQSLRFLRNRLRQRVLPELRAIEPNVSEIIGRFTAMVREENDWLNDWAKQLFNTYITYNETLSAYHLSTNQWIELPIPLQRRAIHLLLTCFPTEINWTARHVEDLRKLASSKDPSAGIDLPGGFLAWRIYSQLWVGPRPRFLNTKRQTVREVLLNEGEWADELGWIWRLTRHHISNLVSGNDWGWTVHLPPEIHSLSIEDCNRSWRVKTRVGSKKIQDLMTDSKLPKMLRAAWPVVKAGDWLWIPGLYSSSRIHSKDAEIARWTLQTIPPKHVQSLLQAEECRILWRRDKEE